MKMAVNKGYIIVGGLLCLMVLPGCDWFSQKEMKKEDKTEAQEPECKKHDSTETKEESVKTVLLSLDGKPIITTEDFEGHLDKIVQTNPQVADMIEKTPAMKYNVFSGMVNQELLKVWARKSKITESEDYKKEYELMQQLVEYELARKYFQDDVQTKIAVSDQDIKKFYEKNKTRIPDMLLSPGGSKALGVMFKSSKEAEVFFRGIDSLDNFEAHAKTAHLEVVDFGLVNEYSVDLSKMLKFELTHVKRAPSIVRVKEDDSKYWICLVTEQQLAEYRPLEEVKEAIEQTLKTEKSQIMFGQKIEALKTVYRAEENTGYFNTQSVQQLLEESFEENSKNSTARSASRVA